MLGGREKVPFLPVRIPPYIFLQLELLVLFSIILVMLRCGLSKIKNRRIYTIKGSVWIGVCFLIIIVLNTLLSHDLGFLIMNSVPFFALFAIMIFWDDRKTLLRIIFMVMALISVLGVFYFSQSNLDIEALARIDFISKANDLKNKQFFKYLDLMTPLRHAAQSNSVWGAGYFSGVFDNSIRNTAMSDYVGAVWLLGELGVPMVALYFSMLGLSGCLLLGAIFEKSHNTAGHGTFYSAMVFGVVLMLVWPAVYMLLANFRVPFFPLTGKDLPFLSLNSMGNAVYYGLLFGLGAHYTACYQEV
jgi:hypothetical protein